MIGQNSDAVDASQVTRVSAIIVAFHTPAQDIECIVKTLHSLPSSEFLVDVVIVQNDDGPPLRVAGAALVHGHGNIGFGAGVRLGIESTDSEYIFLLNPDCALSSGDSQRILEQVTSGVPRAIYGPVVRDADGKVAYHSYADWTYTPGRYWSRFKARRYFDHPSDSQLPAAMKLPGTAVIMKRELAVELGPFDPAFFLYGEDRDLTRRARQIDIPIYIIQDAAVIHRGGASGVTVPDIVTAGQATAALEIAFRRFGALGTYLAAIDLIATSLKPKGSRVRSVRWRVIVDRLHRSGHQAKSGATS
ncbi:glycosyltransferase [Rhodococcus hoagii]|nr:glycosyltransferase [Prescottella equi]